LLRFLIKPVVLEIINSEIRVYGDRDKLTIAPTAKMANTLFNTEGGRIDIGDYSFTGHNVSLITGTHRTELLLEDRMSAIQRAGRDITVGKGVWIGSDALILGPCTLGDHSVIGAGSVVLSGTKVPPGAVIVGVPARQVRTIAGAQAGTQSVPEGAVEMLQMSKDAR
jgi:acetyltransferase-like isoleucine patch superfamily enzyme